MQIIYTANEEVARGLYNPAYKLLQMLPGRQNKGQLCMQKFHSVMQVLMQEVICLHHSCVTLVQTAQNATFSGGSGFAPPCIRLGSKLVNLHTTGMCNKLIRLLSFLQHS